MTALESEISIVEGFVPFGSYSCLRRSNESVERELAVVNQPSVNAQLWLTRSQQLLKPVLRPTAGQQTMHFLEEFARGHGSAPSTVSIHELPS